MKLTLRLSGIFLLYFWFLDLIFLIKRRQIPRGDNTICKLNVLLSFLWLRYDTILYNPTSAFFFFLYFTADWITSTSFDFYLISSKSLNQSVYEETLLLTVSLASLFHSVQALSTQKYKRMDKFIACVSSYT